MGIQDFWPHLDTLASPVDLFSRSCNGQTWGIDSSVLLHVSVAGRQNARAQVLDGVKAPNRVIATYMRALSIMIQYGVTPVAVFDGAPRPGKAQENAARMARREAARASALDAVKRGASDDEVMEQVRKAAHVTPELRSTCIRNATALGVDVIVAPFEADGQLAQLARSRRVDRVMTNDGDLGAPFRASGAVPALAGRSARGRGIRPISSRPPTSTADGNAARTR